MDSGRCPSSRSPAGAASFRFKNNTTETVTPHGFMLRRLLIHARFCAYAVGRWRAGRSGNLPAWLDLLCKAEGNYRLTHSLRCGYTQPVRNQHTDLVLPSLPAAVQGKQPVLVSRFLRQFGRRSRSPVSRAELMQSRYRLSSSFALPRFRGPISPQ